MSNPNLAIRVLPLEFNDLKDSYDLFVVALGFEGRSRYAAETLSFGAKKRIALVFPDRQVLSFAQNKEVLQRRGFELVQLEDAAVVDCFINLIQLIEVDQSGGMRKIALDVSSLSRTRMAGIFEALCKCIRIEPIEVDFIYAIAEFSPPSSTYIPNAHVGPVSNMFAGWSDEPEQPSSLIIGLGYEQDRAMGAVEHIQPGNVWTFIPGSTIPEYSTALRQANAILLDSLPQECQLHYRVERPFDCFVVLESHVHGQLSSSTPVLIPFGPKIYTILCLLVATLHAPHVAVWRVSPGIREEPSERVASGAISCIRAVFGSKSHTESFQNLAHL